MFLFMRVCSIASCAYLAPPISPNFRAASADAVAKLRAERTSGEVGPLGDDVFENAILFLRDALALRTFTLLVKAGRSGHIILALRWLILAFKAGGHPKYAREMMHLVHNLQEVDHSDLILQNWLVNPTGTPNGFVALDLMQEHLNFWIKVSRMAINSRQGRS